MESISNLFPAILILLAFTAPMSETVRVGGGGGNRTVTMDCGSNAFIVGATATGGRDGGFGFNLLRRVKFTCQSFNGSTPGATSTTSEAVADKAATLNVSNGSATCPSANVAYSLDLYAGSFIDRFDGAECRDAVQNQHRIELNIGGDGGSRGLLDCPLGEALFKVEARVGDAIDSLKGFCRAFGSAARSVPEQITGTGSPNPTSANPLIIPVSSNKSISFTISNFNAAFSSVLVGVSTTTDLLGGGDLNPPDFKVELLDPSGRIVATKSFSKQRSGTILGVNYQINANGTWKLRVTNLKTGLGTLNVTGFFAMGL